jgi:argininosuccinate lyase
MLPRINWNRDRLLATADASFSTATDIAEYLVRKSMPFRSAHEVTGKIIRYCIDNNKTLVQLTLDEFKTFSMLIGKDVYAVLAAKDSVNARNSFGGTSVAAVRTQIKRFQKKR